MRTKFDALKLLVLALVVGAGTAATVPAGVTRATAEVTSKPMYAHSTWGIVVADLSTGEKLIDRMGEKMFVPGSIMKTHSPAAALEAYGPGYRFCTPVYRLGRLDAGTLTGNLVLVASGDFSFGLRERPDGTLGCNSIPEIDHSCASTGFAGAALVKSSDPLAALDALAAKVRATGIRRVNGNVAVDDRLFTTYHGWPDGVISPMWVNENLLDITTTPTSPGKAAAVRWRPKTASLRVVSKVVTLASGAHVQPLTVEEAAPGVIEIRGQIALGAKPVLSTAPILQPADFARVAFIEALRRAGVTVSANAAGRNPVTLLPAHYDGAHKVAEHISPPLPNQAGTAVAGHVRVKDGSRVAGSPSGQHYLSVKTQVGYIDAESGRRLVYAVYWNNVPTTADTLVKTFGTADHDLSTIVAAIQQGF